MKTSFTIRAGVVVPSMGSVGTSGSLAYCWCAVIDKAIGEVVPDDWLSVQGDGEREGAGPGDVERRPSCPPSARELGD